MSIADVEKIADALCKAIEELPAGVHQTELSNAAATLRVRAISKYREACGDILYRLRGYNPPDRTTEKDFQIAIDIQDAIKEIETLRRKIERNG